MHESDKILQMGGDLERGRAHIANQELWNDRFYLFPVYITTLSVPLITMSINSKIEVSNVLQPG